MILEDKPLISEVVLSQQDYENTFINAQGSSLEHIRERLTGFMVSEVIS
jgi:hypothetical protein